MIKTFVIGGIAAATFVGGVVLFVAPSTEVKAPLQRRATGSIFNGPGTNALSMLGLITQAIAFAITAGLLAKPPKYVLSWPAKCKMQRPTPRSKP
ncbi:MAG: hypothetical protein WCC81_00165 [Pseudolabrys sp.]